MGEQVTRPSFTMPAVLEFFSQAWKFATNFLFAGVFRDWKYVQQPSCPTSLSAGRPRNSSSEIENETTGQVSAVRPDAAYSLKNGTFVSPFRVEITHASPEAANCLISAMIC